MNTSPVNPMSDLIPPVMVANSSFEAVSKHKAIMDPFTEKNKNEEILQYLFIYKKIYNI